MGKPEHCSQELYDVMKSCWGSDCSLRPSFKNLSEEMNTFLKLERAEEGSIIDLEKLYNKFCYKNSRQSMSM